MGSAVPETQEVSWVVQTGPELGAFCSAKDQEKRA